MKLWRDTAIELPADQNGAVLRDVLSGSELRPESAWLLPADALRELPVAVFLS